MANEVELKLTLPGSEQRRFLHSRLLREAAARNSGRLVNIYYDTPDLALYRKGIALRLRQSQRRWLQTVKCCGISRGGLSSRPEWESAYAGQFDFSNIDDEVTRKLLARHRARLLPVFETNFLRTEWKMRKPGGPEAELLVCLDRGNIIAGGKIMTISEVEIELGEGDGADKIDAIFTLVDQLAQRFTLTPALRSKAERGYRLFLGTREAPCRAEPVVLDSTMSPFVAFGHIAHACLDHLQQNHHGALHSDDAEYIHQMRVAMRRLRAALRLFDPVLPARVGEQFLPQMRRLMAALGKARDFDVLTSEIVDPVAKAMPAEPRVTALAGVVAERHHAARKSAVRALGDPAYGRLLLQAMRELHRPDGSQDGDMKTLTNFANARLKKLRRKVAQLILAAKQDDPVSLHELRIGAKRLRYAYEFFVSLLPAGQTAGLIQRLARLQESLGQLNDLANAGAVLMDCADDDPGLREAVSLIAGWHGQRYAKLLADIPPALQKLQAASLPKAE